MTVGVWGPASARVCERTHLREKRMTILGHRHTAMLAGAGLLAVLVITIGMAGRAGAVVPGTNGKIAFTTDRDGDYEIFAMKSDGTNQKRLTKNTADDTRPAWSPNGKKVAFTTDRNGNNEIYVMNADGSGQTRLTSNAADDSRPTWSPDGAKIAFASNRGSGDYEIFVMNANGTGTPVDLSQNAASDSRPSWSPDGS